MARIVYHAGGCCGRIEINNFGSLRNYEEAKKFIERSVLYPQRRCRVAGLITEVVLTSKQLQKKYLRKALDDTGFKLVFKGKNKNSGNMLNVFLHHPFPAEINNE